MTIKDINIYKLEENFSSLDKMQAHFKENKQGEKIDNETLKEHLELTLKYFYKIVEDKKLENIIKNFEDELLKGYSNIVRHLFKELLVNAIYMHDVGKSNPNFQYYKMKNNESFQSLDNKKTEHSLFSSIMYFNSYCGKIVDNVEGEERNLLLLILMINSYAIARHHGYLKDFFEFYEEGFPKAYREAKEISKIQENNFYVNYKGEFKRLKLINNLQKLDRKNELFNILEKKETWKSVDLYIYSRFVFSLIVSSDFYATSEYETGEKVDDLGLLGNVEEFEESFNKTKVSESIKEYRDFKTGLIDKCPFKENDINLLRSEIFLESEENLLKGLQEGTDIFFLEAPTGSGKTNSSINLALKALENNKNLNKLFYIFPFNTLVEQTKNSLDEIFEGKGLKQKISVVNSITAMKEKFKDEDTKVDYEKTLLARQFLHYPITLSTHVNLFNYLFGLNRDSVFPLTQLANSVVIIDEVQSYKNSIWTEIIIFLKKYSKLLNIKFIIMSATLPNLRELSNEKYGFKMLINNREKYFQNPLFKNRVEVDYSLLDKNLDLQGLLENIRAVLEENNKKIVIEFIKKKSALEFYEILKNVEDELGKEVLLITGDDNRAERKRIINKVKGLDREGNKIEYPNNNIILVATQVIEAGVDIDMDYGFKDISILDSEEQFLGRINRSCKKKNAKVYFFNIDDASSIYKNDLRKIKELTIENKEIREILKNKDFSLFYKKVMDYLTKQNQRLDAENINDFRENSIKKLNYINVYDRMKLIDERNQFSVFLNREIYDLSGECLNREEIWNEYKKLIKDKDMKYAEKQVKLSEHREKMDYFIYTVSKINFSYNDSIGDLTYVEDGEKFFTNGKFNPSAVDGFDSIEFL